MVAMLGTTCRDRFDEGEVTVLIELKVEAEANVDENGASHRLVEPASG